LLNSGSKQQLLIATACSEEAAYSFNRGVVGGVESKIVRQSMPIEQFKLLSPSRGKISLWATHSSGQCPRLWENSNTSDLILFYLGGEFRYLGMIGIRFESPELASVVWGEKFKKWQLFFEILQLRKFRLSLKDFNGLFGFDARYKPQGLSRIAEERKSDPAASFESLLLKI